MTIKRISQFFNPKSVAVIGASNKANRSGFVVIRNLLQGGFSGPIMPVSLKYKAVHGVLAYPTIESLPQIPDLAILCTNKSLSFKLIKELGEKGCKYAILIASGFKTEDKHQLKSVAKEAGVSILGANSLGLLVPSIGLNASLSHTTASKGNIAFISQSASVCSTILDWAQNKDIGFSYFISVGDCINIGFTQLIDFLGRDAKTQAILLYIDNIKDSRKFISAARAAAINKPVIAIKTGKTQVGALVTQHITGDNNSSDTVYDAMFQRAGILRVNDLRELFTATQTLALHPKLLKREQLTILTNGTGPGVMAVDSLTLASGKLAQLTDDTITLLNKVVPQEDMASNPVDICGDSDPERYQQALEVLLKAPEVENLLILHSPSALAPGEDYANIIVDTVNKIPKMQRPYVLTNFMGEKAAFGARKICSQGSIPTYRTPEGAVGAFMHLIQYRRNQKHLTQTPESLLESLNNEPKIVQNIIDAHLLKKERYLSTHQSRDILEHYCINTIDTKSALTPTDAKEQAITMGFPIALKLISPSISSKSDVGGVVLNLNDPDEVEQTAFAMLLRIKKTYPNACIEGFSLQKMAPRAGAQELRIAVKTDPNFGPVILLGESGTGLNYAQAAVALPPLNMNLAKYLIASAQDKGLIKEKHLPDKIDKYTLCALLTRVSQLIVDQSDIQSIELNPVLASGGKFLVLDAVIQLTKYQQKVGVKRLSVRPYPKDLEKQITLKDGSQALLRPIKPEDESSHRDFDLALDKEDRYKRFFGELPEFSHDQLAKMTQIDYDREMAFIVSKHIAGKAYTLGVSRVLMDPDNLEAEFAIVIRSDQQGLGLGQILLQSAIDHCKQQGVGLVTGITLPENNGMIELARKLGFKVARDFEEGTVTMNLKIMK
ncbi:bifunctional acetate--CoA ligase family protein/GNAT family N-acetyltransferase [Pseudoalteromonas denitrificans]|uniref:Acetyltransferase n=1 Tax=Pseudoalteromonas denitrificans DSM 6059 TaxID=1123010 RepID=A0A1I1E6A9_9GAMM|nr:bifunctional acetate--CoA ligase family protein/GNAT family N-acetyltransferase [Pseudoalteromonas denitrificans]SFB82614.1 acetyltransferase [Pseudoalteromonas denitrificans DSM 6059]